MTDNVSTRLSIALPVVAQYISNTERKDGAELLESLLERWKAGRPDIPAHYNPDLPKRA